MSEIDWPGMFRVNAWDGASTPVQELRGSGTWGLKDRAGPPVAGLASPEVDDRDWRHPEVGWGLVLADDDTVDAPSRARGVDAPEPMRRLLEARPGSPVLRFRKELGTGFLRRYTEAGSAQDLDVHASEQGVASGQIPKYLLIYASPKTVPWSLQYMLNMSRCVGRLDLTGEGLENYVEALICGFGEADPTAPVVWSVDHQKPDITWLMARAIGRKLYDFFQNDTELVGRSMLGENDATIARLAETLCLRRPGLVVTTSHGMTGPLTDPASLREHLGGLVDVTHAVLTAAGLDDWEPSGAIWYAHACCSAGSDMASRYVGLLPTTGAVGAMVSGVAKAAGAMIAPLPNALLGTAKPLRAFVGHVEPTFDWTLRSPDNGQVLTHGLVNCLWNQLYRAGPRTPIGLALNGVYKEAGAYLAGYRSALDDVNNGLQRAKDWALYRQLVAMDRQSIVILGDPTVSLRPSATPRP